LSLGVCEEEKIFSIRDLSHNLGEMVHSKFSNESTTMHIKFLGEYGVSAIFNVSNPFIFYVSDDSRLNPFKNRGIDENQQSSRKDSLEVLIGSITRR
jgi:hypothetical protein